MKRMSRYILVVFATIVLQCIACNSSSTTELEPPFDTILPSTDILVAAPYIVEEASRELSPSETSLWDKKGDIPIVHTRVCEGEAVTIWMSAYVFTTEIDAHSFFQNFSQRLGESYNITVDYLPWLEQNDEAMRWYSYEFPCELYEDGNVSEGVIFRVERCVGHVQMEDTNPFIVPSEWADPPIVPRSQPDSMFWKAIDHTILQLRSYP